MVASASMMATSLVKTDWRTCRSHARSRITSSDELVPDPAHGADKRRLLGIVTELLSKSTDEDIDGAVVSVPVDAASAVQDSIATEHAPAMAHEDAEQLELGRREREELAVQSCRRCRPIDLQRANAEPLLGNDSGASTEHRMHPGHQFARLERFRHVVVRSQLEPDDPIRDVAARC